MNSFIHIPKSVINESLAQAPVAGKRQLEPLMAIAKAGGVPLNILEDHQITNNEAEVHTEEADLWLCLEGEITFICDDTDVLLKPGDWLWIPTGVPHQHNTSGTARLVIIKIPVYKKLARR